MKFLSLVKTHNGQPTVAWCGICVTGLVVSTLSVIKFLRFRFAFDVLLGSTIDLFPGILLASTIPTRAVVKTAA